MIFGSSSARDTDFVMIFVSVFPDWYTQVKQEGALERHLQRRPLIPEIHVKEEQRNARIHESSSSNPRLLLTNDYLDCPQIENNVVLVPEEDRTNRAQICESEVESSTTSRLDEGYPVALQVSRFQVDGRP